MDVKEQIKVLLREAEVYQRQGLYGEAKIKYGKAVDIIRSIERVKNREQLLAGIQAKIDAIEQSVQKIIKAEMHPKISARIQDLIQKKFSFSGDRDQAALEGAIALAKFGQYERALKEFDGLIGKDALRFEAAKNMIRCHLAIASADNADAAVDQYKQWLDADILSLEELHRIRAFLDTHLHQKGIAAFLPIPGAKEAVDGFEVGMPVSGNSDETEAGLETPDEDMVDINAVSFALDHGPLKEKKFELEVSFQSGNTISFIIPGEETSLLDNLTVGHKIGDVQFFSSIAIFEASALVSAKTEIKSGPKQGSFSLDLKIMSA
ncbi:MAG: hypothetical protein PHW59_08255 [Desulfobacterales bacterium]|nr:hypothetical protein [Desulfobacterales bacterium]